ncbi:MAG: peptidoglycan editing factor PgeF [Gammaproteobacteria bacterium]|nr:peptidoglycan editing factor PgeF [Gammaproteobacteria bacterium]
MIETIAPDWVTPPGVCACTTTRAGGVSEAPFDSLNLALHVGDDPVHVGRNRELLQQLHLPAEPCWINQTHGTDVVTLELDKNRDADAAVTRQPGVVAVVMTADCLPILLCNRDGSEVAAVHAGWRGLQAGVIQRTLAGMESRGEQLQAWIGPGISQQNFEVGAEVRTAFIESTPDAESFFDENRKGHWLCDLAGLAERVLKRQGLVDVYRDHGCSYRDADRFFSYRRNATTGRMASLIWIK